MVRLALPKDNVFVDLGSGKGRILLLAIECGFSKVVGVELASSLCQMARENVDVYQQSHRSGTQVEIIEADVANYEVRDDETTFFLFNPFSDEVMQRLFEKIRQSLQRRDREIWIIYNNPVHHTLIRSLDFLEPFDDFEYGGSVFHIYKHSVKEHSRVGVSAGR